MKIALGSDHGGFELKSRLIKQLNKFRYEIKDFGTYSSQSCDYPDFGFKVAKSVSKGEYDRGILICKTGLGMSIVANKIPGIRAALCRDIEGAVSSRKHNDANVLVLAANFTNSKLGWKLTRKWLTTDFEGGRHARRVNKITKEENRLQSTDNRK